MKILHISPSYFGKESVVGGGERYAHELARTMSQKETVTLLSFSKDKPRSREGNLTLAFAPGIFSLEFWRWIFWADVIHCHQIYRLETDFAVLGARCLGKKVFATDLGGLGQKTLSYKIPIMKWLDGLLLISEFSKHLFDVRAGQVTSRIEIIGSGVDTDKFRPPTGEKRKSILFVGRLLPHKGIDHLIDALTPEMELHIVGRIYHEDYFRVLEEKSKNKKVTFHTNAEDAELIALFQQAYVGVQPSVYKNYYGEITEVPELLCFAATEVLACGAPAIVTQAGGLPETVLAGETGFVVPPNDSQAIREKLEFLFANPETAARMGRAARQDILNRFTWGKVVSRCLEIYRR